MSFSLPSSLTDSFLFLPSFPFLYPSLPPLFPPSLAFAYSCQCVLLGPCSIGYQTRVCCMQGKCQVPWLLYYLSSSPKWNFYCINPMFLIPHWLTFGFICNPLFHIRKFRVQKLCSTVCRLLALHMANQGWIPGILYGTPISSWVNLWVKRSLCGVTQNPIYSLLFYMWIMHLFIVMHV